MVIFELKTVITIIVLCAIICTTIIGNTFVILSVFLYRPLRTVQNFFIVSLAVADLTVAILVLPFSVGDIVTENWVFGSTLCKLWLTFDVMCCTCSILNLCMIALDRFWAITDPIMYRKKRTMKRVVLLIILVWTLSFLICSPPLLGWNNWPKVFDNSTECKLSSDKGYVIYSSSGSFFIPLIIMMTVYIKIYLANKKRLQLQAKMIQLTTMKHKGIVNAKIQNYLKENIDTLTEARNQDDNDLDECTSAAVSQQNLSAPVKGANSLANFVQQKQKISLAKERRAARTLGIIMGTFVVCWLPFFLTYVIFAICDSCGQPSGLVLNIVTWLGYLNSSLNPVIYTIFNLDFRKGFTYLLNCRKSRYPGSRITN